MKLSIVTIGLFVGMLDQATKYITTNFVKQDMTKYIPVFSVVYGIILGIIGYFMPGVDMGSDLLEAIFIGASAGGASTGVHQIGKQLSKASTDKSSDDFQNVETSEDVCSGDTDAQPESDQEDTINKG